jgi:hypothetical protein
LCAALLVAGLMAGLTLGFVSVSSERASAQAADPPPSISCAAASGFRYDCRASDPGGIASITIIRLPSPVKLELQKRFEDRVSSFDFKVDASYDYVVIVEEWRDRTHRSLGPRWYFKIGRAAPGQDGLTVRGPKRSLDELFP